MAAEKMPAERAALWACKAACERIIDQYEGVTAGIDWNSLLGSVDRALASPGAATREGAVGTLTVSKFRGHLENTQFDYTGQLPEGSYQLFATPPVPTTEPTAKPITGLTEREIARCLVASSCIGTVKMSYESGPYEITRTSINADRLAQAITRALAEKNGLAVQGGES